MSGIDLVAVLEEIQRKFNVEYEKTIQESLSKPGNSYIYVIDGSKNEEFVTFIVYDCRSDMKFDFRKFFDVYDSISEGSIEIIMIFNDCFSNSSIDFFYVQRRFLLGLIDFHYLGCWGLSI